jgi:hypothetical protein
MIAEKLQPANDVPAMRRIRRHASDLLREAAA